LSGADLRRADLRGADVTGCKMDEALIDETTLMDGQTKPVIKNKVINKPEVAVAAPMASEVEELDDDVPDWLTAEETSPVDSPVAEVVMAETPPVDNPVVTQVESKPYSEATRLIRQEIDTQRRTRGKVNLGWKTLMEVDLSGCDLSGADLSYAKLQKVILSGAILRGADLHGAKVNEADLRGADLTGANLEGTDLTGADLHGANLAEARTNWATKMDS